MIIEKLNAVEKMLYPHKIELSFSNRKKAESFLAETNLILKNEPYFSEASHTLTIMPNYTLKTISYWTVPVELRATLQAKSTEVDLLDFTDSQNFYESIAKEKSPVKIISDTFSRQRSARLFELIYQVESRLRGYLYSEKEGLISLPVYINSKISDDKIARYTLTEILQKYLLAPAGDEYFLDNLKESENDSSSLRARRLTKMDELGFPITAEDFSKFINSRNSIMHFRTLAYDESVFLIQCVEKIMCFDFSKKLNGIADYLNKNELDPVR